MQIVSPRVVELFVFQLPSCRFSSGFPYPFHNPPPPPLLLICVCSETWKIRVQCQLQRGRRGTTSIYVGATWRMINEKGEGG